MGIIHLQNHNSVGAECHAAHTESQASAAEPSLHSASLASLCSSKRVAALPFPATPAALTDLRSCLSWQVSLIRSCLAQNNRVLGSKQQVTSSVSDALFCDELIRSQRAPNAYVKIARHLLVLRPRTVSLCAGRRVCSVLAAARLPVGLFC